MKKTRGVRQREGARDKSIAESTNEMRTPRIRPNIIEAGSVPVNGKLFKKKPPRQGWGMEKLCSIPSNFAWN